MIFGALGGWTVAAIAGGMAATVTALFFMKVRHPRVLVPSLLLWRRVLDEDRAVSFWERVRTYPRSYLLQYAARLSMCCCHARRYALISVGVSSTSRDSPDSASTMRMSPATDGSASFLLVTCTRKTSCWK